MVPKEEVRLPPLSSPVPDSWTTIEDEFRIAYALNLSHLDPATMFAPQRDRDLSLEYRVTYLLAEKVMLTSVPSQNNLGMSRN